MKVIGNETLTDFSVLAQAVKNVPRDKELVSKFFAAYETFLHPAPEDTLVYFQLKYLYGPSTPVLNALARIYLNQGRKGIAYLCLMESLRLNPNQPQEFLLAQSLREAFEPKFPQNLCANECSVSVLIATLNQPCIKEAVASVLNQTFQDFELIIINDAPKDEIKSLIDSFGSPKIRYYHRGVHKGLAATRNDGILMAKGEYITFLDEDDIYYPDHIEVLVKALKNQNKKFVYANTRAFNGVMENGRFRVTSSRFHWDVQHDKNRLLLKNYISHLSIMYKKDIVREVGLYNEEIASAEDREWVLRACLKFDFGHVSQVTGEYRVNEKSMTVKNRAELDFFIRLIRHFYLYYRGKIASLAHFVEAGKREEAQRCYQDIIREYPDYFRNQENMLLLIRCARYFKYTRFLKLMSRDFFFMDDKSCLEKIARDRSMTMIAGIVPLLPSRIWKSVKGRTGNLYQRLIKNHRQEDETL